MKITLKYTIVALTLWLLTGCCLFDNTKVIKKVASPMFKELQVFYKKNKRFPTIKERNIMLEKSGCKMNGNICVFEGENLYVSRLGDGDDEYSQVIVTKDDEPYDIIENPGSPIIGRCIFSIYSNNSSDTVICGQKSCLNLRQ